MRRAMMLGAACLAGLILAGAPAAAAEVSCGVSGRTPAQQDALIRTFDRFLAQERSRRGLGKVAFSRRLSKIAGDYAHVLDEHGHFDHTGPDGSTPGTRAQAAGYCYRFIAENLALGMFNDAEALFQAWMNSPGHRDNMMHDVPVEYGLAANCPPRGAAGPGAAALKAPPAGSIADLMGKTGSLDRANIDDGLETNRRPEIFVMLLAKPC